MDFGEVRLCFDPAIGGLDSTDGRTAFLERSPAAFLTQDVRQVLSRVPEQIGPEQQTVLRNSVASRGVFGPQQARHITVSPRWPFLKDPESFMTTELHANPFYLGGNQPWSARTA